MPACRSASRKPGALTPMRARVAVGADGARSLVRRAIDTPFEGETYPEVTLLLTTQFPFEDHLEGLSNVTYCWKDDGNFSLLKVPGRWRVSLYPREDLSIEEQLGDAMIQASMNDIVPRDEPWVLHEKRDYRVHQRIVPTYVRGRVALAGDAAHLNSPSGGMGLNGGLHDAFELADALADVLKRGAPLERLMLYDRRRRPIARDQIIAQADRNRARMREKDPARRRAMLTELQAVTADRARLRDYLLKSSMIEGLRQAAQIAMSVEYARKGPDRRADAASQHDGRAGIRHPDAAGLRVRQRAHAVAAHDDRRAPARLFRQRRSLFTPVRERADRRHGLRLHGHVVSCGRGGRGPRARGVGARPWRARGQRCDRRRHGARRIGRPPHRAGVAL